jgi:signal transduction histidine kinase
MVRVCLFIFPLLATVFAEGIAQPIKTIDSLRIRLKQEATGESRIDIINQIASAYFDFDDSLGLHYANRGLTESLKINYLKGIKYSYLLVGVGHYSVGDHKQAVRYLKKSIHTELKEPDRDGLNVYAMSLIGNIYRTIAKYDSAKYYYEVARRNFNEYNQDRWSAWYKNVALMHIRLWENQLAIKYLDSARNFRSPSNTAAISIEIYTSYVDAYQNLGQDENVLFYVNLSCNNSAIALTNFTAIKCLLIQTKTAYRSGNYPTALNFAIQALKFLDVYAYPPQQVEVLTKIGEVYAELSEYTLAGRYYLQALSIAEQFGFEYERAYLLCELAWIYKDQNNYALALDYVDKSQRIRESIGDRYGIALCHNTRGLIFLLQKKYNQSIEEHEKSRRIRQQIGHREGVAASIFNLSLVYNEQGLDTKALQYMLEAIKIEENTNNKQSLAISYDYLAAFLIKKGQLNEAEKYLIKCNLLAKQTGSKLLLRNNTGYFADYYEAKGDYKSALQYRKQYQQLNDSIYAKAGAERLAEMQALYQLDRMEQQIELLDKENALKESNLRNQKTQLSQQRIVIIASMLVVILISIVAFVAYRYYKNVKLLNRDIKERNEEIQAQTEELTEANEALYKLNREISEKQEEIQAQSEELQEANETISEVNRTLEQRVEERTEELRQAYKELDTFFYRASHDFRRPLTTFMGLAEVARVTIKDVHALELFSRVNETAHYLDKMLFKLQSISDLGAQEMVFKEIFIKDVFDNVCDMYRDELKTNHIKSTCTVQIKGAFLSYPALLKIIIENLMENSIFFSRRDGQLPYISLVAFDDGDKVILTFEDNGEGISEDFHDRIFEMYFRGSEHSKGNGLGLYIVKKAIEKLGGKISLVSSLGKGTTFTLEFNKFLV